MKNPKKATVSRKLTDAHTGPTPLGDDGLRAVSGGSKRPRRIDYDANTGNLVLTASDGSKTVEDPLSRANFR